LVQARFNRGNAHRELKQFDQAVADYSKAIGLEPDFAEVWANRGRVHAASKQYDKAIADYRKSLELSPRDAGTCNNFAWLLATCPDRKLRDPGQATELARKAVELDPKNPLYPNTLGVAQYRAGDFKAAIEALNKSMERRNGGDSFDWLFLAMAHWELGNKDEARQWYDRAVAWMEKNRPKDEELRRFRAEAEELLGIENG
jgi:tetratricopeptide (TPR) repeat protein